MRRLVILLKNEFVLFRTAIPVHIIGIFQPAFMFSLMALVLVTPTFDMQVSAPSASIDYELVSVMQEVRSPIGSVYINPVVVDVPSGNEIQGGQLIEFIGNESKRTALQHFGLIDSNMVKNFRNRLTSAALILWNELLGNQAITINQVPWLSKDIAYSVYFGMAMMPLAAMLASTLIGAFLSAQEFEFNTIIEYHLSPTPVYLILGARLLRLSLTGMVSGLVLMVAIGITTGVWPSSLIWTSFILLVLGLIGGCVGSLAGLAFKKVLPAFLIGLALSFFTWIMGSAFGLAAGFSGPYEILSRIMPNTYAVELLFPLFYRVDIGSKFPAIMFLSVSGLLLIMITMLIFKNNMLNEI
jgi:ABC-type multidrug transport system permease subunit